jgi:hypothetical protein
LLINWWKHSASKEKSKGKGHAEEEEEEEEEEKDDDMYGKGRFNYLHCGSACSMLVEFLFRAAFRLIQTYTACFFLFSFFFFVIRMPWDNQTGKGYYYTKGGRYYGGDVDMEDEEDDMYRIGYHDSRYIAPTGAYSKGTLGSRPCFVFSYK